MTKKLTTLKGAADKVVKNIRRKTYSSEEKIRIVLYRREGIAESLGVERLRAGPDP